MRSGVYEDVRRDILSCAMPPGAEIRDSDLADRFSVSRSPVRDALLRLEGEGLVLVHPRKGYRVAPISLADARDLFDFREVLEPAVALRAAEDASDVALATLDTFRTAATYSDIVGEPPPFVRYNRDFHVALANLCPNRRLRATTVSVIEQFDRLVMVSFRALRSGQQDALVAEHCTIIDALQVRDGRRAARILGQHAGRARRRVLDALSQAPIVP